MGAMSDKCEQISLDWLFGGSTPTRPAAHYFGLSLGVPTDSSASEMAAGYGASRASIIFGAAASPAGSVSNNSAFTVGPFISNGVASGWQIWDTSLSVDSGNVIYYGTLTTARSFASGDTLTFAIGSIVCTLD